MSASMDRRRSPRSLRSGFAYDFSNEHPSSVDHHALFTHPSQCRRAVRLRRKTMMRITLEDVAARLLPRPRIGRALATGEMRTLARVAEVLLEGAPSGVTPEEVAANVDTFLVTGKSRRAWRVRVLLRLVEVYPLATHGKPFSRLSRSERARIVRERWVGRGGLGRLCAKVRNLVILGAYGDKRAGASTGYVPVPQRPRFVLLRAEALRREVA